MTRAILEINRSERERKTLILANRILFIITAPLFLVAYILAFLADVFKYLPESAASNVLVLQVERMIIDASEREKASLPLDENGKMLAEVSLENYTPEEGD